MSKPVKLQPNPCMFCRSTHSVHIHVPYRGALNKHLYWVTCWASQCETMGPYRKTRNAAVRAWNLMHPPRRSRSKAATSAAFYEDHTAKMGFLPGGKTVYDYFGDTREASEGEK